MLFERQVYNFFSVVPGINYSKGIKIISVYNYDCMILNQRFPAWNADAQWLDRFVLLKEDVQGHTVPPPTYPSVGSS